MPETTYLVQYGRTAFVGRFRAALAGELPRGTLAVVRTPRGVEVGTVLGLAAEEYAGAIDGQAGGELLRRLDPADQSRGEAAAELGRALLAAAEVEAAILPLVFVDVEVTLDGATAILHVLPWDACDADPLFAAWSARFGLAVRMLDVSRTPTIADPKTSAASCGKEGCGSSSGGGCTSCGTEKSGCSTGGCSRGAVKSAKELTNYFADLRQKMEAEQAFRQPLL